MGGMLMEQEMYTVCPFYFIVLQPCQTQIWLKDKLQLQKQLPISENEFKQSH